MSERLVTSIELLVGLVCLVAAWGAWSRLRSRTTAAFLVTAGIAAAGHAVWMLVGS